MFFHLRGFHFGYIFLTHSQYIATPPITNRCQRTSHAPFGGSCWPPGAERRLDFGGGPQSDSTRPNGDESFSRLEVSNLRLRYLCLDFSLLLCRVLFISGACVAYVRLLVLGRATGCSCPAGPQARSLGRHFQKMATTFKRGDAPREKRPPPLRFSKRV